MRKFYNSDAIYSNINLLEVAEDLGMVINESQAAYHPDGNGVECLCPFHHDTHLGSGTKLSIFRGFKGIYCFKCNRAYSIIKIVEEIRGCNYIETLRYLASFSGGIEQYLVNSGNEDDSEDVQLLSAEELKAAGFNVSNVEYVRGNGMRGAVIGEYMDKPNRFSIPDDCYIVACHKVNKHYQNIGPEYSSFMDFIASNKNDVSDTEKPVIYSYLLCQKTKYQSINALYFEDKNLYYDLVSEHVTTELDNIDKLLDVYKDCYDRTSNSMKFELKQKRRTLLKAAEKIKKIKVKMMHDEQQLANKLEERCV